ncbi:NUDIX hydrolase [Brevundimonas sp. Root1423]|uniref:NUDIX hydrolase n=1 Tax=Brevundimonas sp. Root1423 TaxID=1736462 RepID=UPI0006F2BD58|nr:NUDIX hydrolase [Brevundimonas sp. Root1423]KQY75270.1 NUDIX hydrolase [Brevundimonas sp. Root1423]
MTGDVIRTQTAERRQVAALPWRKTGAGLEIMLVTSRETRRWVTPKGGRMPGKTDAEAAAIEALEEAGIEGEIAHEPLGTFRYLKILKRRAPRWCVVAVYALEVHTQHDDWQERGQRERVWVSQDEAVRRVDEPDLKALIAAFAGQGAS